jgi:hypothetical protein
VKTVRQRILDHLQVKQIVSAFEISRALKMTAANARHHLAILVDEGAVEATGIRPAAGRPSAAALPDPQTQQHSLDHLAAGLLMSLSRSTRRSSEKQPHARRLEEKHAASAGSLTQRLNRPCAASTSFIIRRGEAHSQAPHLILGHRRCRHPARTRSSARWTLNCLHVMLNQQTARLAMDSRGAHTLCYCDEKNAQK